MFMETAAVIICNGLGVVQFARQMPCVKVSVRKYDNYQ